MKSNTTAERLQQIMKERSLKQADILRMCQPYCKQMHVKLAKTDLSNYVNGKFEPKQDKLAVLGKALNLNEAWIMGYEVRKEKTNTSRNKLNEFISEHDFTNAEIEQIINYASFLLNQRK